ncbi:MAG: hypothetical protein ACM3KM_04200 [Acidobacteriaceae bacterium]
MEQLQVSEASKVERREDKQLWQGVARLLLFIALMTALVFVLWGVK